MISDPINSAVDLKIKQTYEYAAINTWSPERLSGEPQ